MSVARRGGDEAPVVSARVRCLVVVVWALLLGHFVATFLWAAPGSLTGRADDKPASRADTGALSAYMTPVFAQNWSVFAPSPLRVEYALRVRGVYPRADGGLTPGPWIDATAVELRALTGRPLPGASERPARRLASDTRAAYLALPEEARVVVLRSPTDAPAPERAPPEPWPALRASLLDAGAAPGVVDDYLARDRALAAYATQVLRAGHVADGPASGSGVVASLAYVQARIVRHGVAPYGARERPEPAGLIIGARPPHVVTGQDDAAFHGTWDALDGSAAAGGRAG
ncbi:DUF5819 family protein [Promicromonospora iranensis]|uniref:DUF5819 family protein n=1 Tax=Promicromonospora iranensis TaxID=1105144 RepID=UPI0023A98CAB|nr:DUF5819 family protein [Promicromonospora iranensis]